MNVPFYLKQSKVYIRYHLGKPIPCSFEMAVTQKCNLRCKFCDLWKHDSKDEIRTEHLLGLIDDLKRIGVPYAIVTGGEPLLRDDIPLIGSRLREYRIFATLTTNATLVNEQNAESLAKSYDFIRVSMDGYGKAHDTIRGDKTAFKRAYNGLQRLLKVPDRSARIAINYVLTDHNYKELESLSKIKGINGLVVMPEYSRKEKRIMASKKTLDYWRAYRKELISKGLNIQIDEYLKEPSFDTGKKNCDAAKLYYACDPYGNVTVCSQSRIIAGNIKEQSFYDIWRRGIDKDLKASISRCNGCYARCTTEMSMIFRKNPIQLARDSLRIHKTYGFLNK